MRVSGIVIIGLIALGLVPGAGAQQRKFKDEALQQYLVPEITQMESKLDKLAERLLTLEAELAKLKQQQADLAGDIHNTQGLQKATDSSVTSLRISSQQDLLGLKTDITEIRRNLTELTDLLRKSGVVPAPAAAPVAGAAPTAAASDGYVTQVGDGEVTISLGSSAGVKVGMRFGVFRASDPQARIGTIEVTDVLDANNSRAKIVTTKPDTKFEFSDIVRPL